MPVIIKTILEVLIYKWVLHLVDSELNVYIILIILS